MGPLTGRRIVITRRVAQGSDLARLLEERGAEVIAVPAIAIVPPVDTRPLDRTLRALRRYEWLVFTSANAVRAVLERMTALGLPPRLTEGGAKLASIGAATSVALRSAFPDDDVALEPAEASSAAGLARELAGQSMSGARVLLPCSSRGRDELWRALEALGAKVDRPMAYRTIEPADLREQVASCLDRGFDLAAFASPSAVEAFAAAAGARAHGLPAVAIGPTTAEAARAAGFDLRAVATPSTAEGLLRAVEAACGRRSDS